MLVKCVFAWPFVPYLTEVICHHCLGHSCQVVLGNMVDLSLSGRRRKRWSVWIKSPCSKAALLYHGQDNGSFARARLPSHHNTSAGGQAVGEVFQNFSEEPLSACQGRCARLWHLNGKVVISFFFTKNISCDNLHLHFMNNQYQAWFSKWFC